MAKEFNAVKYVKKSGYRTMIVKSLKRDIKIPSEIAKDNKIEQKVISNNIKQLRDKNIIECLNPEAKRGRLYRLTELGKQVGENI